MTVEKKKGRQLTYKHHTAPSGTPSANSFSGLSTQPSQTTPSKSHPICQKKKIKKYIIIREKKRSKASGKTHLKLHVPGNRTILLIHIRTHFGHVFFDTYQTFCTDGAFAALEEGDDVVCVRKSICETKKKKGIGGYGETGKRRSPSLRCDRTH